MGKYDEITLDQLTKLPKIFALARKSICQQAACQGVKFIDLDEVFDPSAFETAGFTVYNLLPNASSHEIFDAFNKARRHFSENAEPVMVVYQKDPFANAENALHNALHNSTYVGNKLLVVVKCQPA